MKIDLKKPYGTEEIEIQDYNTGKRTEEAVKDAQKKAKEEAED